MREIEIKLKVNNLEVIENKLRENGYVFSLPLHQYDIIYSKNGSAEFQSAKEGDIILRIRRENNIIEFNLKQQKSNEMDNLEYETELKDQEAMDNILRTLGWFPEIEVKKVRRKGKLGNYEICLDQVDELGNFIEKKPDKELLRPKFPSPFSISIGLILFGIVELLISPSTDF